jgi:hypothetical protein
MARMAATMSGVPSMVLSGEAMASGDMLDTVISPFLSRSGQDREAWSRLFQFDYGQGQGSSNWLLLSLNRCEDQQPGANHETDRNDGKARALAVRDDA